MHNSFTFPLAKYLVKNVVYNYSIFLMDGWNLIFVVALWSHFPHKKLMNTRVLECEGCVEDLDS